MKLGYNNIQGGAAANERHEYEDGSVIDIRINYGLSTVTIYIPPEEEEEEQLFEAACPPGFKCFIFATIEKVACFDPALDPPDPECSLYDMALAGERYWYDISFCYKDRYVLLHNYQIYSAGWERYEKGQHVLLGPDAQTTKFCCVDSTDLALAILDEESVKIRHGFLDVYPVHILGGMMKADLILTEIQ